MEMAGYGILGTVKDVEKVKVYEFYNSLAFQRSNQKEQN